MNIVDSTLQWIKERKRRIENNEVNGIPFAIPEFRTEIPVLEKGFYIGVTGQTKSGKSKFLQYCLVNFPVLYAYNNPDKIRLKILYFALEDTPEEITLQFMSYLLYMMSGRTLRVSPTELKSSDKDNVLTDKVLALLESAEYQKILQFYANTVEFCSETNNVGINIRIENYAKEHGTIEYEYTEMVDPLTGELKQEKHIAKYVPNDPDEYVMPIVDHVSLITPTINDHNDLKLAIMNLSKNMVKIKNKYHYIPVIVQQQASSETGGIEARKSGNIRPTKAGLSDCKSTGNDVTLMFGVCNPNAFEYPSYLGYDVTKLGNNFRVLEVILNRHGRSNGILPIFFDGACNYFKAMPAPKDIDGLQIIYDHIKKISRVRVEQVYTFTTFFVKKVSPIFNIKHFANSFTKRKVCP